MTTKLDIMNALESFIDDKINTLIGSNPVMKLFKPTIKRVAMNYVHSYDDKLDMFFKAITDKEGNIDINVLLDETLDQLDCMEPTTIENKNLGDLKLGGGKISMIVDMPFVNSKQEITLTRSDFEEYKQYLSSAISNRNTMRY